MNLEQPLTLFAVITLLGGGWPVWEVPLAVEGINP